jgi:protein-tyrosine phosphatase
MESSDSGVLCASCGALTGTRLVLLSGGLLRFCDVACAAQHFVQYKTTAMLNSRHHYMLEDVGTTEPVAVRVFPRVWLGGIAALADCSLMEHIGAVVSLVSPADMSQHAIALLAGTPDDDAHQQQQQQLLRQQQHTVKRAGLYVPIVDRSQAADELRARLREIAAFIERHVAADTDVLVHCMAGHSRSVSALVYYAATVLHRGQPAAITVNELLDEIRAVRPLARPNAGFMRMLREEIE